MEHIYKCPNCGESKNLHYNYDYTKQHRPIKEVMCNFCGEFFDGDMPVSELTKEPIVSDNFQIGPEGAYEHEDPEDDRSWDVTLMDGLEEEEWDTKPGFVERRMKLGKIDNDQQWDKIYESYVGVSDLIDFVDWLKDNYIAPEKI